ncbi:type II toxin-antitoxin system VapC family toxin [Aphanothece sacrum]|uniref:Twitching motility protein PilT n=1 Tax=Aphanothece sacrum FPU1 TaxID=1920663 RepID=A0A401IGL1_APHSA|nr:type II toxin-antitoxin system VapC family toxin [Aphanothece sacrum]GBF80359.1 twitching motility protein PilT [Aphanothece sacrum FPU1]GBF83766.1 twitching motility protein [Aphanothece sacrum FPU3]
MILLLDTHTFLWFVQGNSLINPQIRALIVDSNNNKLLSIASVWEMAIKHSISKLNFDSPFREFVEEQIRINNIDLLLINFDHLEVIGSLPFYHRDPFDRIIIAQAMVEYLPIISKDSIFDNYPVQRIW